MCKQRMITSERSVSYVNVEEGAPNENVSIKICIEQTQHFLEKKVFGVFGYITLQACRHLILIDSATKVGTLLGADIYKVDNLQFEPLWPTITGEVSNADKPYIEMINNVVR